MPILTNLRHEQFVQHLIAGLSATRAYAQVYGKSDGANRSASRLLSNVDVCARLNELQTAVSAGVMALEIGKRDARIHSLQRTFDRIHKLIEERAVEHADIPGGATGLLVKDYKGRNADQPVYKADTPLLAELRATMRQAAEELGQWVTKSEPSTISVSEIVERLNAGRRRAREAWEKEQALKSGTPTET